MKSHCDRETKTRKPGVVVLNKNERYCVLIDIAIPGDIRANKKEGKNERFPEVKREMKRMWSIRSIKVIPVVVGALCSASKKLKDYIEELGIVISLSLLQKTALGRACKSKKILHCG